MQLQLNEAAKPHMVIVDDFLTNPNEVRDFALGLEYEKRGSAGVRSKEHYLSDELKQRFEGLLDREIVRWETYPVNGCFQYCTAETLVVHHADAQTHGGILFLTPQAPPEAGTTFFRHRVTGRRKDKKDGTRAIHNSKGFFDPTVWEPIDRIGNIYNRLALWPGRNFHAASCYFGKSIENSRLFQIFFFDCK